MRNFYNLQLKIARLANKKTIAGLFNRIKELNGQVLKTDSGNIVTYIYFVKPNENDDIHRRRIMELEKIANALKMKCECVGFVDDIPLTDDE